MIIINESHYKKAKIDFSYFNGIYYLARIILKVSPKFTRRVRAECEDFGERKTNEMDPPTFRLLVEYGINCQNCVTGTI